MLKASNTTREKLLQSVTLAYTNYDSHILERIEGIQHEIYRRVLADGVGNQFDMPNSGVRQRQKQWLNPCDSDVTCELYQEAQATN